MIQDHPPKPPTTHVLLKRSARVQVFNILQIKVKLKGLVLQAQNFHFFGRLLANGLFVETMSSSEMFLIQ